ncbi:DUF4280 domain-containing protein [Fangia hongkongensis]|uniref:DUF4280 domain-containing protein n=1 Tax=Fangia hongkongensis TaxID=270495 RepID=UPI00036D3788|nr:DUF4280 domain-containing protein [Fangia hongkongensis]MBK2125751.1 DUF4280 domain-containing protein [Fangia hongkongensis]
MSDGQSQQMLSYFQKLLQQKKLYEDSDSANMTKLHSDLQRDLTLSSLSPDMPVDDSSLAQLRQLSSTSSKLDTVTNFSTSQETSTLASSVKSSHTSMLKALSTGDSKTYASSKDELSKGLQSLKTQQMGDLQKLSALRPSGSSSTSTASDTTSVSAFMPSDAYLTTLSSALPEATGSGDPSTSTQTASGTLTSLHQSILKIDSSTPASDIDTLSSSYQSYLLNLQSQVMSFNQSDQSMQTLMSYPELTEVMQYPKSASLSGNPEGSQGLPVIDRAITNSTKGLSDMQMVSLPESQKQMLDQMDQYYASLPKSVPGTTDMPDVSSHIASLSDTVSAEQKAALDKLQSTMSNWSRVQDQAQGTSYSSTFNQQVTQIMKPSSVDASLPFSAQLDQISAKYKAQGANLNVNAMLQEKQMLLNQNLASLPSQQLTSLQQNYTQMISPVMSAFSLSQGSSSAFSEGNTFQSFTSEAEGKYSALGSTLSAYKDAPNNFLAKQNYQSALSDYQSSLTSLSSSLPQMMAKESAFLAECQSIHSSICDCTSGTPLMPDALSSAMSQFSAKLSTLPQLPTELTDELNQLNALESNGVSKLNGLEGTLSADLQAKASEITGPYTAGVQSLLADSKIPEAELMSEYQNSLTELNNLSQKLPDTSSLPNLSVANCVCDSLLGSLSGLSFSLAKLLPPINPIVNIDFIQKALEALLAGGQGSSFDFSSLEALLQELESLNFNTLQALSFNMPPGLSIGNLPPLSVNFSAELQALSNCLQSVLNGQTALPAGVSLSEIQSLQSQIQGVLSYNNSFYTLDQINANMLLSEIQTPNVGALMQEIPTLPNGMPMPNFTMPTEPNISILVPNINTLLAQAQSCPNISEINTQVNTINALLASQNTSNASAEIGGLMDSYLSQATAMSNMVTDKAMSVKTSAESTVTSAQSTITSAANNAEGAISTQPSVTNQPAYQQMSALMTDITIELSDYSVATGSQAAVNAASSAQSSSAMAACLSSQVMCTFGIAPGVISPLRPLVTVNNKPASNINDTVPMVNVVSFPGCSNPANPLMNPLVYPWACMPMLAPFIPTNPLTTVQGAPINTINNKAMCSYAAGGVISFMNPSQTTTMSS